MLKGLNSLLCEPLFADSTVGAVLRSNPLGFIDIGARGGIHPLVEPLAGVTAVLAFEPDESECARLQAKAAANSPFAAILIKPVALAGAEGRGTLYRFATPANDSLLPENPCVVGRYRIKTLERVGTMPVRTTTLDQVLFEQHDLANNFGEFLKMDVQGLEYELLRGAVRTLAERTVAIFVETAFFPVYEGQKLFSEVELFLRERGFSFYGFQGVHFRSCKYLDKVTEAGRERARWADAVFFKDPIPMCPHQKPLTERGNFALFACALLTGYYDFALELALKTWAQGQEAAQITKLVHRIAHLEPSETYAEVLELAERMKANPERANFEVGRFVDNRRHFNDYDDVPPFREV